jgi:hypothetical protein
VEQGAAARQLRQAAAPAAEKKDIFCLIAAAAEADEVARTEAAQAEAATDIQSALRGIPFRFRNPTRFHLLEDRHGARLMTRISNVSNDYGERYFYGGASNHGREHRHCTITGSVRNSLALLAYCLGQTETVTRRPDCDAMRRYDLMVANRLSMIREAMESAGCTREQMKRYIQ